MSAVILSTTLNAAGKVLRKSTRSNTVDGLVSLVEEYTIRLADIGALDPEVGTKHSVFSSAAAKYPRMLVETTAVDPLDGDLANLKVTYVGLDFATGLPPAYVTTVGQPGVGIFGADTAILVKYLTDASLFDTLKGGNISLNLGTTNLTLPTKRLMPTQINGTTMPPNPRQREYRRAKTIFEAQDAAVLAYQAQYNQNSSDVIGPRILSYAPSVEWIYAGYVQTGISLQRRGLFNQIEEQFTEYFRGSDIFYQTDGTVNLTRVNSFSNLNYTF